jgi:hypothetical protein
VGSDELWTGIDLPNQESEVRRFRSRSDLVLERVALRVIGGGTQRIDEILDLIKQ